MKPYLQDADLTLYNGDALTVLRELPEASVHMCVTSPPFYGLRDYGTGKWEGGDEGCDHKESGTNRGKRDELPNPPGGWAERAQGQPNRDTCGKCGATRSDQQIGLEETPEQWVAKLVEVFREVKRVLRPDGTLWLEVGDSYAQGVGMARGQPYKRHAPVKSGLWEGTRSAKRDIGNAGQVKSCPDLKPKDLIGAPWLLAFALRADGWYLRSDIVWSRPNPMPESVTDRPTKANSYIFLLSKQPRYFFDQEAVREPSLNGGERSSWANRKYTDDFVKGGGEPGVIPVSRNIRSVWTIATQPYPEAHFATYPEELVRRCILAGTSERGCCPECGAAWVRETQPVGEYAAALKRGTWKSGGIEKGAGALKPAEFTGITRTVETTGWRPSCDHWLTGALPTARHEPIPCTVLDPFGGAGTTALVARKHGRRSILIELSEDYCKLAANRLSQLSLLSEGVVA